MPATVSNIHRLNVSVPAPGERAYTFTLNEKQTGVLTFHGAYSGKAVGRFGEEQWELKRKPWTYTLLVQNVKTPGEAYTVKFGWTYTIKPELPGLGMVQLKSPGFWGTAWEWRDKNSKALVQLQSNVWSRKKRGSVAVLHVTSYTGLLVLLGWFLLISYQDEASMAAIIG